MAFPKHDVALNITLDLCPMTFVKTKIALEDMAPGAVLMVTLRAGEPLENVSDSVRQDGHCIEGEESLPGGLHRLWIRRSARC